jgi:molybdopterin-guanine dinucleotide biosynthesis protein A
MILGLVLAGGKSSRFGSDKALAQIDGHSLLALAVDRLSGWCEQVVIVGREAGPAPCLPDWPRVGMGPLGGLSAALRLAQDQGYDAVLSCGVDSPGLPDGLPELLAPAPSFLRVQPVVGLWPTSAAAVIEAILISEGRHSMRQFAQAIGARAVEIATPPANINTPADLAELTRNLKHRRLR